MPYIVGLLVVVVLVTMDQVWWRGHYMSIIVKGLRNAMAMIGL
jgi:hypothetical protein